MFCSNGSVRHMSNKDQIIAPYPNRAQPSHRSITAVAQRFRKYIILFDIGHTLATPRSLYARSGLSNAHNNAA